MKVWIRTNWNFCSKVCPNQDYHCHAPWRAEHPVRRMLAEGNLETFETVLEPEEVQAQPEGWKKISEERTSQLDWVAPKIIKRVLIRPRYVKTERFAIPPLPPQPIEQGMVGCNIRLTAHVRRRLTPCCRGIDPPYQWWRITRENR